MKIGIYGTISSYTHQVAELIFKNEVEYNSFFSMQDLLKNTQDKKLDVAVIPIENNLVGRVDSFNLYANKYKIKIVGEFFYNIDHKLIGIKGTTLKDIKKVYSHEMAIKQCDNFLFKNNFKPISAEDTAYAVEKIKKENDTTNAAIGSEAAALNHGLEIISSDISNEKFNTTRFVLVTSIHNEPIEYVDYPENRYITSIIFSIKSAPSALYKVLGCFSKYDINLTRIESSVSGSFNKASFFVDFEGNIEDEDIKKVLRCVENLTNEISILGTYKRSNFRDK